MDETEKGGIVMHKNSGLVAKHEYLFPSARVLFFSLNYVHFHVWEEADEIEQWSYVA